jgi:hypothetical protein
MSSFVKYGTEQFLEREPSEIVTAQSKATEKSENAAELLRQIFATELKPPPPRAPSFIEALAELNALSPQTDAAFNTVASPFGRLAASPKEYDPGLLRALIGDRADPHPLLGQLGSPAASSANYAGLLGDQRYVHSGMSVTGYSDRAQKFQLLVKRFARSTRRNGRRTIRLLRNAAPAERAP